jgi:hypothetical protein
MIWTSNPEFWDSSRKLLNSQRKRMRCGRLKDSETFSVGEDSALIFMISDDLYCCDSGSVVSSRDMTRAIKLSGPWFQARFAWWKFGGAGQWWGKESSIEMDQLESTNNVNLHIEIRVTGMWSEERFEKWSATLSDVVDHDGLQKVIEHGIWTEMRITEIFLYLRLWGWEKSRKTISSEVTHFLGDSLTADR